MPINIRGPKSMNLHDLLHVSFCLLKYGIGGGTSVTLNEQILTEIPDILLWLLSFCFPEINILAYHQQATE